MNEGNSSSQASILENMGLTRAGNLQLDFILRGENTNHRVNSGEQPGQATTQTRLLTQHTFTNIVTAEDDSGDDSEPGQPIRLVLPIQRNVIGDQRLNSGEHVQAERANHLNREEGNPFAQVFWIQDWIVEDDSSEQP